MMCTFSIRKFVPNQVTIMLKNHYYGQKDGQTNGQIQTHIYTHTPTNCRMHAIFRVFIGYTCTQVAMVSMLIEHRLKIMTKHNNNNSSNNHSKVKQIRSLKCIQNNFQKLIVSVEYLCFIPSWVKSVFDMKTHTHKHTHSKSRTKRTTYQQK